MDNRVIYYILGRAARSGPAGHQPPTGEYLHHVAVQTWDEVVRGSAPAVEAAGTVQEDSGHDRDTLWR